MIRSMTGYGAAEGTVGRSRVSIDVRSVNHRFFNVTIKLPPELNRWEGEVREALRQLVTRGHVTLSARYERLTDSIANIDEARFAASAAMLRELRDKYGLGGDVDVATVLRLPDVIAPLGEPTAEDGSELTRLVASAAEKLRDSREREGSKLRDEIVQRLSVIDGALSRINERAPQRVLEHRDRLRESIRQLAAGVAVDEQRLAQEVAVLADRHDVQEELARFSVHLGAFRQALNTDGADSVGKRLGFLLQEMLREANTTASKANDAGMQGDVVTIKEELERIREQVENLE
ncbi:MAG TPA: YicC/YloC family endoribonuclease [Gemmatimonadaceae bacterium]|nr:YicC/YloC family endoribonuclease [Gemmatimonadaceae bacterium]